MPEAPTRTNVIPNVIPVAIDEFLKGSFIDYSMSVIVSRALPDVRDGLKPSQRRTLYAMKQLGLTPSARYRKCAKICGDTSGDFHPHGELIVYPTLVRMAQPWTMNAPLVQGQGNFGSIDGDPAAQMRYTEARLAKPSMALLADINKETVDFVSNYDDTTKEPTVFPAKFPNLLVNGATGIAVGMATNMAPHNLEEVIAGIITYIDNPDITIDELMQHIKAPDFPTKGIIYGYQGVRDAFRTGKGRIVIRGKATIETKKNGKEQIIVTELPYMVNKAQMIEKTATLINDKKIEGIADMRDESGRDGLRVVYDLKRNTIASVVLNNLYKKTALQTSFSVNNVALVKGKPVLLNLKQLIECYVAHRLEVVTRRTQYEYKQAKYKLHLLAGYIIALDNLDPVIKLIKAAKDSQVAKEQLIQTYDLSDIQAKVILEMRLQRLTGLERKKIVEDRNTTQEIFNRLTTILAEKTLRMQLVKDELVELKTRMPSPRKSIIEHDAKDLAIEDIIPNEDMVITISNLGYIKRTILSAYRTQNRGGVGAKGVTTKKEDFSTNMFIAKAHDYLLIFTKFGKVYWKRVYDLPKGEKTTQGRAMQNLIAIENGDQIISILKVTQLKDPAYIKNRYVIFCTKKGIVKKTPLAAYANPRTKGIWAIKIKEGDRLLEAVLTQGQNEIILASNKGKAIRFSETAVRPTGRNTAGVRGMHLDSSEDKVIGMVSALPTSNTSLLVVTEHGYGKRSLLQDYRKTNRGGKGVKTLQITKKTGALVAIKGVKENDELMTINTSGITMRLDINKDTVRIMARATQGVRLLRLKEKDAIASVAHIDISSITTQEKDVT